MDEVFGEFPKKWVDEDLFGFGTGLTNTANVKGGITDFGSPPNRPVGGTAAHCRCRCRCRCRCSFVCEILLIRSVTLPFGIVLAGL
jgi:hypothetical protein